MTIIDTNNPELSEITLSDKTRRMIISYLKETNKAYITDDDEAMLDAVIAERKEALSTLRMDYLISFPEATDEELDDQVGRNPIEGLLDDAAMFYENSTPRYLAYI